MAYTVYDWLEPDGLLLIESWARDGMNLGQVAAKIGIHKATLCSWMQKYPQIKKAMSNGRELVDYKVENALLKSALGYKTKEVKIVTLMKNGKVVEERKEVTDREFAPNVNAIQTWLYSRRPDKWKSLNSKASLLEDLEEDTSIKIIVERANGSEVPGTSSTKTSSAVIEETDTDWVNDVNQAVTVMGNVPREDPVTNSKSMENKRQGKQKRALNQEKESSQLLNVKDNESLTDDDWGNEIYVRGKG